MKNWILILMLLMVNTVLGADVKISNLPLGVGSTTGINDSFPYVDATSNITKRLTLYDIANVPLISQTYAPLISPTFTGKFTLNGTSVFGIGTDSSTTGSNAEMSTSMRSVVQFTNASLVSLKSIATTAVSDGYKLTLINNTGNSISLVESGSPSSGYAALTSGYGSNLTLPNLGAVTFQYKSSLTKWILNQGTNLIPLASGVSGTLSVPNGGTGLTSGTSGGILAFTASGTLASSGVLSANQVVIGGGAGVAPSSLSAGSQYQVLRMGASNPAYGSIDLSQSAAVTGTLANAHTTATDLNTASAIVARDGSGNFSAGTVSAALSGNATTASALAANPSDCSADTYATTIAANGNLTCATVTNAGLAGSIAASKLVGSDIATVGTVTAGTWSATTIAINKGGTGQTTQQAAIDALLPSQTSNSGKVLTTNGTTSSWTTASSGSGDVTGPASSVSGEVTVFNDTTGKKISRGSGTGFAKLTSGVLSTQASISFTSDVTGVPLTTKGDVLGYSTLPARIGISGDGTVMTADSSSTTGVSWQYPGQAFVQKSGSYTATSADSSIAYTSDGTLAFPAAASFTGKTYHVFTTGTTTATIDPNSAELICGHTTIKLSGDTTWPDGGDFVSDGTNWQGFNQSCTRTCVAQISNGGSAAIASQRGNCFSGVNTSSTGVVVASITSGMFSSAPFCWVQTTSTYQVTRVDAPSTSAVTVNSRNLSNTLTNTDFELTCMGPR